MLHDILSPTPPGYGSRTKVVHCHDNSYHAAYIWYPQSKQTLFDLHLYLYLFFNASFCGVMSVANHKKMR